MTHRKGKQSKEKTAEVAFLKVAESQQKGECYKCKAVTITNCGICKRFICGQHTVAGNFCEECKA